MSFTEEQLETIVREVLRRLRGAASPVTAASPGVATPGLISVPDAKTLNLPQRLITTADLDKKLTNITTVVVPPRAVVTPAAVDYLRERGVALKRGDCNVATGKQSNTASLLLATADTRFDPTELTRLLKRQAIEIERLPNTSLTTVVAELSDQVAHGGRLGVLLTDRPSAALCLANRVGGVRAAQGNEVAAVAAAIKDVGVNVLIVEPKGRGLYQLKQIVDRFASGVPHACPAELAARLR